MEFLPKWWNGRRWGVKHKLESISIATKLSEILNINFFRGIEDKTLKSRFNKILKRLLYLIGNNILIKHFFYFIKERF